MKYRSSNNQLWAFSTEKPALFGDNLKSRTLLQYSDAFIKVACKWGNNEDRRNFVNGFEAMFYSLTEKPPGSIVRLNDAIRLQEFGVSEFATSKKELYRGAVRCFMLLLEHRGIPLPTTFHKDIEAFEIVPDLVSKFKD